MRSTTANRRREGTMKKILSIAGIVLVLILGLQTHESARAQEVSVTCKGEEAASPECVRLGPLGSLNPSGVRFWLKTFVRHGLELPQGVETALRSELAGY
jgi:hypothetical protein